MQEPGAMVESSDLLDDPSALRARAAQEGYLFFKGLLDPAAPRRVRSQIVDVLARRGLIDTRLGPERETVIREAFDALPPSALVEQTMTPDLYIEVQKIEDFHSLPHDAALLSFYQTFFGEAVLPHPRHIARLMLPGPKVFPTPPHQDFPLVQGSKNTWTCWIPLGEVPRTLGPLAILAGSHRHGVLETTPMSGYGGSGAKIAALEPRWVTADFAVGDVVTFSSLTVHRSLPQQDRATIRLSMDCRYQPLSEPIQAMALRPHMVLRDWKTIYKDWSNDALKYYWRKHDLRFVPFDLALLPQTRQLEGERLAKLARAFNDTSGLLSPG